MDFTTDKHQQGLEIGRYHLSRILKKSFIVPSYQRGYKWRPENVTALLRDVAETEDRAYCLQPVVVAKTGAVSDAPYLLIDGQQRLTTIWLIVNWVAKNHPEWMSLDWQADHYTLSYDERAESNEFLEDCFMGRSDMQKSETCDTHYFKQTIKAVESFAKDEDQMKAFLKNLQEKVEFIWYEVPKQEGPKHFERLNSSKIPLTDAELVKALLLSRSDYHRTRIAQEWDIIEYGLQRPELFSFICRKDSEYMSSFNRIDLVIEIYRHHLLSSKQPSKQKEEEPTEDRLRKLDYGSAFELIDDQIKQGRSAISIWKEILTVYYRIESWFRTPFLYNLIGFLVETGANENSKLLFDIYSYACSGVSQREFEEDICTRVRNFILERTPDNKSIKDRVDEKVSRLEYKNESMLEYLLLFNILSKMSVNESVLLEKKVTQKDGTSVTEPTSHLYSHRYIFNDRFHFELYKSMHWDKEHIHATASETLTDWNEWIEWICDVREDLRSFLQNHSLSQEQYTIQKTHLDKMDSIANLWKTEELDQDLKKKRIQLSKDEFSVMYKEIVTTMEGSVETRDTLEHNGIGNMALLDRGTNRSYKAAPFSTKRRTIIQRIKDGVFVPIGTQNVFMKMYTQYPGEFYHWSKTGHYGNNILSDTESHLQEIINTLYRLWK